MEGEGEEVVKQTCIEVETATNDQGEDVQVYYLDVPHSEDGQVLDISNILAQEGIQIVEADSLTDCKSSIVLEADGSLCTDQSATQSAQALLNLSKAHSQSHSSGGIKVVDILDVNNQIPSDGDLTVAEHVQLSEPVTATYVVDENGTMVSLSEYRETHGSSFLEVEEPSIQTVAVCACWCGKEFLSQEDLDKHKLIHSKRRLRGTAQLKCELCSEVFNTSSKLASHHRVVHPDGMPWECPICFRRFSKKLGLKVHLRAHSGLKQHKCSYCERSFSYKNALLRHIRLHTKDKPYKCTICGEVFAHMWAMRRHRAIHKPKHLFQCDLCSKTFKQKQTLFIHARVHTGHKPYTCEICRKSFTLKSSLNQHLRIHTGERPKVCPICEKAFRQTSTLKSHMKLHTHQKPHKCRYCKQRFSLPEEMLEHESVHLSNKSWQCDECGMRFRNQSLLSRHIRKHTNERPFQCKICGKSFSQSGSLQSHMRTHTKEKPYQCRLCPKTYTTSGTLLLHIRRAHNLEAKSVKDVFPSTHYVEDQKVFTIPTPVSSLRNNSGFNVSFASSDGDEKAVSEIMGKEGLVFEEVVGSSQDDVITTEDGNVIIQRINPLTKDTPTTQGLDEDQEILSDSNVVEEDTEGDSAQSKEKDKRGKKMSVKELMRKRHIKPGSFTLMNVDSGQYKVIDMEKENSLYAQARQEAALGLAELSLVGGVVVTEKKSGTAYRTLARGSDQDASEDPSVTKIILSKEGGIMNSQDPHQCPECKRIFGRKSIMVEHRRIHTDEKPYKCDYCPGGFRQSAQLTCHIRNKHTKEKRYHCTFCQKRFLSHSITVRHINFHHKLKLRVCESMCPGWKVDDAIFIEKSEPGEEFCVVDDGTTPSSEENRGTMKYGRKSNITILNSLTGLGSPTVKVKFGTDKKKVALKSSAMNNKGTEDNENLKMSDKQSDVNSQSITESDGETLLDQQDSETVIGTWYVCETCAMQFNSMESLRWHLRQVHNTTLAESDVSYVFEDEPMGNVMKEVDGTESVDKESTTEEDKLADKPAVDEEESSSSFTVLGEPEDIKDFRITTENLVSNKDTNEIQLCSVKTTLKCSMCTVYCGSRVELEQHMMNHDNEEIESAGLHRCDTCGVVMKNTQQITKHILRVHGVENIYGCSICDKEFFQESSVLRHMKFFHKWEMKIRGEGNIPVLLKPASEHLKIPGAGDKDKVKGKVKIDATPIKRPPKNDVKVTSRFENDMTFISLEVGDLDHLQLYRDDGQEVRFEVVSSTDKATVIRIKDPQKELTEEEDNPVVVEEDDADDSLKQKVSTEEINVPENVFSKSCEDPNVSVMESPSESTMTEEVVIEEMPRVVVVDEKSGNTNDDEVVFKEDAKEIIDEDLCKKDISVGEKKAVESESPSECVRVTEDDKGDEQKDLKSVDKAVVNDNKKTLHVVEGVNITLKSAGSVEMETNSSPVKVFLSNVGNSSSSSPNQHSNTQVRVVAKHKGEPVDKLDEKPVILSKSSGDNTKVRTISVLNKSPTHGKGTDGKEVGHAKRTVTTIRVEKPEVLSSVVSKGEKSGKLEETDSKRNEDSNTPKSSQETKQRRGRPSKRSPAASPLLPVDPSGQDSDSNSKSNSQASVGLKNESAISTLPQTPRQDIKPSRSSSGRLIKRKRFADEDFGTSISPRKSYRK